MEKAKKTPRKTLPAGIAKVLKRLHYPVDVILLCVCVCVCVCARVCGVLAEDAQS
jgi:hypothetical protein